MTPVTPEQAALIFIQAFVAVASGFMSAPITLTLVALLKRLSFLDSISAPILNLSVSIVLTVIYWLGQRGGLTVQFQSVADIIVAIGTVLLSLGTTVASASVLYRASVATDVPIVSYSRSYSSAQKAQYPER